MPLFDTVHFFGGKRHVRLRLRTSKALRVTLTVHIKTLDDNIYSFTIIRCPKWIARQHNMSRELYTRSSYARLTWWFLLDRYYQLSRHNLSRYSCIINVRVTYFTINVRFTARHKNSWKSDVMYEYLWLFHNTYYYYEYDVYTKPALQSETGYTSNTAHSQTSMCRDWSQ